MSGAADSEHDARKRSLKSFKGLWHDAFRTLKGPLTSSSSSGSGEPRLVSERADWRDAYLIAVGCSALIDLIKSFKLNM